MDFAYFLFHLLLLFANAVSSQRVRPSFNVNQFPRPLQVPSAAYPNGNTFAEPYDSTNFWNRMVREGIISQSTANWMIKNSPQTVQPTYNVNQFQRPIQVTSTAKPDVKAVVDLLDTLNGHKKLMNEGVISQDDADFLIKHQLEKDFPGISVKMLRQNNDSLVNLPGFENFDFDALKTATQTVPPPTIAWTTEATTTETPTVLPKALQKMSWTRNLNNSTILIPPEKYPDGFDPTRKYYLGFKKPDLRYQVCSTYTGGNGRCRYLQFCANEDYLQSLDAFLEDACLIGQDYMGVCCMENSGVRDAPAIPPADPDSPTSIPTTSDQTPSKPISKPVNRPSCGLQQLDTTRVVGGQLAQEGEWPWMASIIRYKTRHICGGTLITDRHVLTASHCFASQLGDLAANITVRLGEHDFRIKSSNEREFEVKAIYMPEEFSMKTLKNDIAIVHLAKKVDFTDYIQPLCLPPSNVILNGQSAYVAGWGSLTYGGQISPVLVKALLPIWDQIDCQKAYPRLFISSSQMCAGYKEGGQDTCQGDSGGPLMYRTSGGRWSLIGIVSFGRGCGEKKAPGVYTRITSYLDWIKATVLQSTD